MRIVKLFTKQKCPNCPKVKRVVEEYIKKNKDVGLELYDVGEVEGLAESAYYDIFSTPTVLVLKDNKEVSRFTGVIREENLK